MFSSTPVERLSRQIILELNPTRVSQIQLPKNPDPPDTRTLFPSNALGSIVLLIASRSSLMIGSFNLDARPRSLFFHDPKSFRILNFLRQEQRACLVLLAYAYESA